MSPASDPLPNLRVLRVRDGPVLLDSDLAALYAVETKFFNRAIKRNAERFPPDFAFQLTKEEFRALRFQIGTSKGRGGRRYLPWVFTEHGAVMAASVLNSPRAVEMSVYVVRAFVRFRRELLTHASLETRLTKIEKELLSTTLHCVVFTRRSNRSFSHRQNRQRKRWGSTPASRNRDSHVYLQLR